LSDGIGLDDWFAKTAAGIPSNQDHGGKEAIPVLAPILAGNRELSSPGSQARFRAVPFLLLFVVAGELRRFLRSSIGRQSDRPGDKARVEVVDHTAVHCFPKLADCQPLFSGGIHPSFNALRCVQ
jgi:hypothetical protein